MNASRPFKPNSRLGFHYFPDDQHFREGDLAKWLPELKAMGVRWLVLNAPIHVAIPEGFLRGLLGAGIQPILHYKAPIEKDEFTENRDLLFSSYAKWGVKYVVLFDRPNRRYTWPTSAWAQSDLVERFLDIFIPAALQAINHHLRPVFPPLEPGGDYWDTAFLRDSLNGIRRRGHQKLTEALVLSAYAYATDDDHPLNWGEGGPERWPGARPYYTPTDQQDHRSFHIYEWYTATAQAVLGRQLPIILLGIGDRTSNAGQTSLLRISDSDYTKRMITIAQMCVQNDDPTDKTVKMVNGETKPLPSLVLAGNFSFLTSSSNSSDISVAGFYPDQPSQQFFETLRSWNKGTQSEIVTSELPSKESEVRIIQHYLLLPLYEWGVSDWHLDVIRPFVSKYHPTVGFSLDEASQAAKVTIIGGSQTFPEAEIERLRVAGCTIERISGDGTSIATQLASL
jgi:hypothetical protein